MGPLGVANEDLDVRAHLRSRLGDGRARRLAQVPEPGEPRRDSHRCRRPKGWFRSYFSRLSGPIRLKIEAKLVSAR